MISFPTWTRRLSLRAELAAGFAAVIALTIVVGAVSLFAQARSIDAVNKLVAVDTRIADLSLASNVAMLKARRAEKDFLIFQKEFGFEEARSRYATVLKASVAEVGQDMADIRALSSDPGAIALTRSIGEAAVQYEAGFLRIVALYGRRGLGRTGFVGHLRERGDEIEAIATSAQNDRLSIASLALRQREANFLERGLDKNFDALAKAIASLKADLAGSHLPPQTRATLLRLADDYNDWFLLYVQTDRRIAAEQGFYLAAAHTAEPLLEELHARAVRDKGATHNDAEAKARVAVWTICIAMLMASLLGIAIAMIISRHIATSVRECLIFASRVAGGDLSIRLPPKGETEFGVLAAALNAMTGELQERESALKLSNALLQEEGRGHQIAAERVEYLAYYDSLTTLPNRGMFSKLLNHAIALAHRDGMQLAVLFLDLDHFKNINDTLGHQAGDLLLQEVGKRLRGCLRESDTVARLGGDEFVVLLTALQDPAYTELVARKILAAVSKPFVVLGQEFLLTTSIGVSVFPKGGADEQTLMKNADIAMYKAKAEGKNNFQLYSEALTATSSERLALESSLRRALEHDKFVIHYQPKMDARSAAIVGVEALIRWHHPRLGVVAPGGFLSLAEETGLIVSIGKWVLKTACVQNMAWRERGLPALTVAVNLSRRQFFDEGLLRDTMSILGEARMSPEWLELEIAESTVMQDVEKAMVTLKALKALGVRVAIDGFGAGYSSLTTLSRFPIDTIKIDGSFVRGLCDHAESRRVADAIIAMGRTLSLTVIAEGVETKEQADFLRARACDELQGLYFSKAVSADELTELLEAQLPLAA